MSRTTAVVAVVLVVIAGAAWALWPRGERVPATLIITAPAGGEVWDSGSEHTLSWNTRGVLATDKISVTIRRIPPPPLQEEGQEFDPIIFTGLPNTGSTTWKIAPMYPDGTYVIGVSAYRSVPIMDVVTAESAEFSIRHPSLSKDLYPLYKGADWNAPVVESFLIGTTSYSGAGVESAPLTDTMDPG